MCAKNVNYGQRMWTMCKDCELCAKNVKYVQRKQTWQSKFIPFLKMSATVPWAISIHTYSLLIGSFFYVQVQGHRWNSTIKEFVHFKGCLLAGFSLKCSEGLSELEPLTGFSLKHLEGFPLGSLRHQLWSLNWTWTPHGFFPQTLGGFFPWDHFAFNWWSLNPHKLLDHNTFHHYWFIAWSHSLIPTSLMLVFVSHRINGLVFPLEFSNKKNLITSVLMLHDN